MEKSAGKVLLLLTFASHADLVTLVSVLHNLPVHSLQIDTFTGLYISIFFMYKSGKKV